MLHTSALAPDVTCQGRGARMELAQWSANSALRSLHWLGPVAHFYCNGYMISASYSSNIIVVRRALTLDPLDGQNPVLDSGGSQQKGAGSVFEGGGSQITGGGSEI